MSYETKLPPKSGEIYVAIGMCTGVEEIFFSPDTSKIERIAQTRNVHKWRRVVEGFGLIFDHAHIDNYPLSQEELNDRFMLEPVGEATMQDPKEFIDTDEVICLTRPPEGSLGDRLLKTESLSA